MLPQSSHSPRGARRSSVGAKPRVCVHCGRSFRRTEHLERHVRTHTKEKPFTCFCGAAFTRRDLLKRHTRITHEENNPPNTGGLISPNSQPDNEENPVIQQRHPYDAAPPAPRTNVPIPVTSPAVAQWPGQPQHGTYIPQSQPIMNPDANHAALGAHPTVTHDAEILEAAQLLLPGGYRGPPPPPQPMPYFPEELNHFQEFTHFLDSIGLPAEWLPMTTDITPPIYSAVPNDAAIREQPSSSRKVSDRSRGDSPFRSWLPSVPPGDQSLGSISDYEPPQESRNPSPLRMTEEQRQRLAYSLEEFRNVIPDFVLPSRHTLSRYLTSFFQGFHTHLPFMHSPTLRINDHAPELILGICTVGAQYRQEHRNAERLFYTGRTVLLERMAREPHVPLTGYSNITVQAPISHSFHSTEGILSPEAAAGASAWRQIESIRTLLVLMAYASWEPKQEIIQEAFSLQSMLVRSLRDFGLAENVTVAPRHIPLQWHEWAEEESIRRTRIISFCFVHIHSIAYNVYPKLRSSEIHLRLPCATKEWKATTASEWEATQREPSPPPLFFQEALAILLQPSQTNIVPDPIPTPLGNYILLHGLLQRIHLVSELSLPTGDHASSLPTEELNRLERALRAWTSAWQQAPESSLDPHNENGPIPFTSSALLGMAYVRLSLNLGPYRQLQTRDPYLIAATLHRSPRPGRNYRLTPALIYSAHALSIPVRLGIDHVARSQAFFWSVRHSIAGFECAILLSKWLFSLTEPENGHNLSENENRILQWTRRIVQEAYDSMDTEDDDILPNLEPATLGLAVIKIWSRLFRKNTQWPFINLLGESLKQYLAMLPG